MPPHLSETKLSSAMNTPDKYSEMTPRNREHCERALRSIPWGTQTNAKRFDTDYIPSQPPFIQYAKGCRMWDLDDREYIDYRCALGPIILGYQYQAIDDAVKAQIKKGTLFSMASPIEAEAAEAILNTLGWADKIRFMKSGADACACCLRIARSHTGRDHFLTSGYHGYQDWFAMHWPNSGIPESLRQYVHSIEYGDLQAIEQVFDEFGDRLAAVHVVPVEWSRNPSAAYLQKLRQKCDEYGTVLIFDEVLTGFRLAHGGAAQYFGVTPDLAAYAKGMANGYPVSAYAGKATFMDTLDKTIITTTYAGETLSLAASIAVMQILNRDPVFEHIFKLGNQLRHGFDEIFQESGFPAHTLGLDPAVSIHFDGSEYEAQANRKNLFNGLYKRGIFANNEWFVSYSHQPSDIEETLDKTRSVVRETV